MLRRARAKLQTAWRSAPVADAPRRMRIFTSSASDAVLDRAIFCWPELTAKMFRNGGDYARAAPKTIHKSFGYRSR